MILISDVGRVTDHSVKTALTRDSKKVSHAYFGGSTGCGDELGCRVGTRWVNFDAFELVLFSRCAEFVEAACCGHQEGSFATGGL
jgi:hypothetical protein